MAKKIFKYFVFTIMWFIGIILLMTGKKDSPTYMRTNEMYTFSLNPTSFERQSGLFKNGNINQLKPRSAKSEQKYIFNCTNINKITIIKHEIGGGRSKIIDVGMFNGEKVVIKRISNLKKPSIGYYYRQLLFLKEILMRDQLKHPGLIKMFGYCVRSIEHDSYKAFSFHGEIAAVYEYGVEFNASNLVLTVETRLQHATDLAELLVYLKNSPIGDMIIGDFNKGHFLMVKGKIKLIDLDYMHNIEYPCQYSAGNKPKCPYHLKCDTHENETENSYCQYEAGCNVGICTGYNAKFNMKSIFKTFLRYFLEPEYFPTSIRLSVAKLLVNISRNDINAEDLVNELNVISMNYNRLNF